MILICVAVKEFILQHVASSVKDGAMGFLALSVNSLDRVANTVSVHHSLFKLFPGQADTAN